MKLKIYLGLTAVLLIAIGVICIINPISSFAVIARLIGLLVLVSGVVTLLFGLRLQAILPNAASNTLMAIFQIMIGIIFVLDQWVAQNSLIVIFSLWVMLEGIYSLMESFTYKRAGFRQWWLMLIFGVLAVLLGFLAICHPEGTAVAITALVGIGILSMGAVRLAAIPAISALQKTIESSQENK